jgi:hypothetical protein
MPQVMLFLCFIVLLHIPPPSPITLHPAMGHTMLSLSIQLSKSRTGHSVIQNGGSAKQSIAQAYLKHTDTLPNSVPRLRCHARQQALTKDNQSGLF